MRKLPRFWLHLDLVDCQLAYSLPSSTCREYLPFLFTSLFVFFSWISIVNLSSWMCFVLNMLAVYSGSFEFSQNTLSYCSCHRMGLWRICVFVIIVHVICRTDCLLGYLLILSCPTDWVCSLLTSHPFEGCNIHNVVISYIWTDKGSEFYNKQVQDFLKEKHVTRFFSRNERKLMLQKGVSKPSKLVWVVTWLTFRPTKEGKCYLKSLKVITPPITARITELLTKSKRLTDHIFGWMLTTQFQKRKPQTKVNKDDSL